MAEKRVPLDALPRAFMWTDGNTYVPHRDGTGAVPPELIVKLVEMGVLDNDRLPDDADPNDVITAQTQQAALTGGAPPSVTDNGDPPPVTGENADIADQTQGAAAANQYAWDDPLPDDFPGAEGYRKHGFTTIRLVRSNISRKVTYVDEATMKLAAEWLVQNMDDQQVAAVWLAEQEAVDPLDAELPADLPGREGYMAHGFTTLRLMQERLHPHYSVTSVSAAEKEQAKAWMAEHYPVAEDAPPSVTDGGEGVTPLDAETAGESARQYTAEHELPDGFPGKKELNEAGYTTIGQVEKIDVTKVTGIGPVTAGQIGDWIAENVG